jgi:predicted  nucleic acid-binding Zn-ribbon protein
MATLRRCPDCGRRGETVWHDLRDPCPECESKPKFNKWLRTAMLNNHLYASVERADTERKSDFATVKAARQEARARS